jgi:ribosomal protein S18 acetylase RimI-like enzyme
MEPIKIITTLAPARWKEYRGLRLEALSCDPSAFARTHKEDAALPDKVWQDHLVAAQNGVKSMMIFAQHEQRLIGLVGAIIDHGQVTNHRATIISMFVSSKFRRQGIGKKLLKMLLDSVMANPRIRSIKLEVNVNAPHAIKLYESFGFKKVGLLEKALHIGDEYHDEWLMIKMVE